MSFTIAGRTTSPFIIDFSLRRTLTIKTSNKIGTNAIRIRRAVVVAIAVAVDIREVARISDKFRRCPIMKLFAFLRYCSRRVRKSILYFVIRLAPTLQSVYLIANHFIYRDKLIYIRGKILYCKLYFSRKSATLCNSQGLM